MSRGNALQKDLSRQRKPHSQAEQESLYEDLARPIVTKSLQGFNGTVFAYGQTGSGKSWSMMGSEDQPGVIPRLNDDIFAEIHKIKEASTTKEIMITVAYLEIYNEVIKDLLNPSDKKLEVRQHPKLGIYVQGLAELVVQSSEDVVKYIDSGNRVRKVASTNMNARSSRSHSCFILKIKQKDVEKISEDQQRTTELSAKINLVDLAGSERQDKTGATGARLKEGAAINKSLSTLGQVINSLAKGDKHIPYRDSKLTRLLQESLGGNSVTMMIAALSPADNNFDETLSTLRYASNAKQIKNASKKNEDVTQQVIRELRNEIAQLRAALAEAEAMKQGGGDLPSPEADGRYKEMEEKLRALKEAQTQDWEKQKKLSALYEQEREKNLLDESKIKSVMQTIKTEKMETLKLIAAVEKRKQKLKKTFDRHKHHVAELRALMTSQLEEYNELFADGGEEGPNADRLQTLLDKLEAEQEELAEAEASVAGTKRELKEVSKEEKAAREQAAAQTLLLQEDADLREKIKLEERRQLEEENRQLLAQAMEEQKAKLEADTEAQMQGLLAKYSAEADGGAMKELEERLIQSEREKKLLELELSQAKQNAAAKLRELQDKHASAMLEHKTIELRMFRAALAGFEQERDVMLQQAEGMAERLAAAVESVDGLSKQNAELAEMVRDLGGRVQVGW